MSAAQKPEVSRISPALLDHRREASTIALLERQADLASLTEEEFERRLVDVTTAYRRLQRIFETLMIEGVHYNTKRKDGRANVFQSPNLTQEGAEVLRKAFRLTPHIMGDPIVESSAEYASVTVTYAILDTAGRIVAERSACVTSMEPRFFERARSRGRADQAAAPLGEDEGEIPLEPDAQALKAEKRARPLYTDARETLHQCHALADKRAIALATADATGIRAFLKEKSRQAMAASLNPAAPPPWSQAEKDTVYAACKRAGIKTVATLRDVVLKAIGHEPPSTGAEVEKVLAAIAVWTPEAARQAGGTEAAVKDPTDSYGEPTGTAAAERPVAAPAPAAPSTTAPAAEAARSPEDEALDLRLATQ